MNIDTFSQQPRHIKCLVIVFFPIYGAIRVSWKVICKVTEKTWNLAIHVIDISMQVFDICRNVYNALAPVIWYNFLHPLFVYPVKTYIINPTLELLEIMFVYASVACVSVCNTMALMLSSVTDVWNSPWF